MDFALDPRLELDTLPVAELPLSTVRLMNDARYPWLVLVPRRPGVVEVLDLAPPDQDLLWAEIRLCARVVRELWTPDKLNVAALGNVVPQLHVHVVGRRRDDDAWPRPVWGVHPPRPWDRVEVREVILRLRERLAAADPEPESEPDG
jgi:diadenosine tetraphosphate (Ap4A) HIT family hydrolase